MNDSVKCYIKGRVVFHVWSASYTVSGKFRKLNIFRFCDNICYYLDALLIDLSFSLFFHSISFLEHSQQIFIFEPEQLLLDSTEDSLATQFSEKENF